MTLADERSIRSSRRSTTLTSCRTVTAFDEILLQAPKSNTS